MLRKELANSAAADVSAASEEVIYKIDIPANRYDMLCLEGIARALNIFRGRQAPPRFRLADMAGERRGGDEGLDEGLDGCLPLQASAAGPHTVAGLHTAGRS